MKVCRILFGSVLAGILIGIGATAYIAAPDIVSGSLFFTVGLFAICFFGVDLFTGRSGYLLTHPAPAGLCWGAAAHLGRKLRGRSGIQRRASLCKAGACAEDV